MGLERTMARQGALEPPTAMDEAWMAIRPRSMLVAIRRTMGLLVLANESVSITVPSALPSVLSILPVLHVAMVVR